MTYKEAIFFIGKCLTLTHDKVNLASVLSDIKNDVVDWEAVVKASTSHFVFPALYHNLKRADLLTHLPEDLVSYMEHITKLNKERNIQIIDQAKEINTLLKQHGIIPIFLKGTGFLLQPFYGDIAERMTGDIDFLVGKESFPKAVELLKQVGYKKTKEKLTNPILSKHYPRLFHEEKLAAVEVHIEMVRDGLSKQFNYDTVKESLLEIDGISVLSYEDQLTLTILAKQYNDHGSLHKTISLRNSYDTFLLSQKIDPTTVKEKYRFFFKYLNPYLCISSFFLNAKSIKYVENFNTKRYKRITLRNLTHPSWRKLHFSFWNAVVYCRIKIRSFFRVLINKEFRKYHIKKLLNS